MFISKKKLEKIVNDKAQVMADDRMQDFWRQREIDDRFNGMREHIHELEKRISALEKELHPDAYDKDKKYLVVESQTARYQ